MKIKNCNLFVASELLQESAGTPRQLRQYNIYQQDDTPLFVLTIKGWRWRLYSSREMEGEQRSLTSSLKRGNDGRWTELLRFFKQDLMLEFVTIKSLTLYLLLIFTFLTKKVKTTYVSSPPFPGFLLFFGLFGLKYEVDLRDPWSLHPTLAKFSFLRKALESRVLANSNKVSVATEFMSKELLTHFNQSSLVEYNWPDLKSNEFLTPKKSEIENLDHRFQATTKNENHRTITYCGTTPDGFYNLPKIGEILAGFLQRKNNFQLYFIGCSHKFPELEKFEQTGRVVYIGRIARRPAMLYTMSSDFSLFFGHQFDGYLTTKIFEAIALEKKIIPIDLDENYEASKLIEDYGQPKKRIHTALDFIDYLDVLDNGNK